MIRFIWQNWWRHKERFLLLLVGALIVSSGLSYLVGLSQTNKGTIVDALQQRWKASYDIVVRPPGSRSVTEDKKLLEPNYLSGISGGITLDQYRKIQQIEGVEVAAPIAMIGYMGYQVTFDKMDLLEEGVYRVTVESDADIGPRHQVDRYTFYFTSGLWDVVGKGREYGVVGFDRKLGASLSVLLAGVDPQAEAALVGLDEAVLDTGNSRYFTAGDDSSLTTLEDRGATINKTRFPVLVNNRTFVDQTYTYTIERLDLPFDSVETAAATMEQVKQKGGESYLGTVEAVDRETYSFTSVEAHDSFIKGVTGIDPATGKPAKATYEIEPGTWIANQTSPVDYRPVSSPFQTRWPFAYEVGVYDVQPSDQYPIADETFRPVKRFGPDSWHWPHIDPYWIGFYDPGSLNIAQDPLTELPMETYRPATATLVLDADGQPVNPPIDIKPTDRPYDFLTNPPGMLTTIDAAAHLLGDAPISAIRIKVAGVTDLSDESQQKLEAVAAAIEAQTGLITDITLGSSPQPTLTHIPAIEDQPELGWLQQPWVKTGSSIAIFRETKIGLSGVIASVIAVAVVYVFATNLVSLLARRKELAVLLAVGWRPRQLAKMIVYEALLLGSFVALVSWTMLGVVLVVDGADTSLVRVLLTGLFGWVVYGLGAVIPAMLAARIAPFEAMRTGEISKSARRLLKARGILSMAVNYLFGKMNRTILSIVAIALPTSLLTFFIFITFRLQGVMYTTWLGQYVALEVGAAHYLAMGVALAIAILTTAEIMWQNVAERRPEIALLKALGWRNGSIRALIWWEGLLTGLFAGIVGLAVAALLIWSMYRQFPVEHVVFMLSTGLIPIAAGWIGSALPAEKATRVHPAHGVAGGQYTNKKKTEKRLKWGMAGLGSVLFAAMIAVLIQLAPEASREAANVESPDPEVDPTTGDVTEGSQEKKEEQENKEQVESGETDEALQPTHTPQLGEAVVVGPGKFTADKTFPKPPTEAELSPPSKGMKYVSVQVTLENLLTDGSGIPYDPYRVNLLTSEGLQSPSDITVVKNKGWNHLSLESEGKVTTVNTYEVPEKDTDLKLALRPAFYPEKLIVVNLTVD